VSSTLGRGSTFFAVLPLRPQVGPDVPVEQPDAEVSARTTAPRVLVVEDDPDDRHALLGMLSGAGYRAEAVGGAAEAAERLRRERFAAVLLGLLSDGSGLQVLESLRLDGPNRGTPVILAAIEPELAEATAVAIQGLLAKPVTVEDLRAALAAVGVTPGQGRRLLVVDDNPVDLALVEAVLQQAGYVPSCYADGASALAAASAQEYAAVVLDLHMPEMDGLAFLDRLRRTEHGKRLPVLVWTGKTLSTEEAAQVRARTQGLIRKGEADLGSIREALADAIAKHEAGTPDGSR